LYHFQVIFFKGFKQAQRRDDDISIVNAGMKVVFDEELKSIKDIALSFGGMAPTTVMASNTAKQLIGR
jgi:xanthine dehydrogenase/oxidase